MIPIEIKNRLRPNFIDLSTNPPAITGPIKLDNSNKIIKDALAEINLLPLKRADNRVKDIVYIKYISPQPTNVSINEIMIE